MSKEVMQQALDMLNEIADHVYFDQTLAEVITALEKALEEKREPVAWANNLDFDDDDVEIIPAKAKGKLGTSHCDIPLFTAPPQRTWVGLTDEERERFRGLGFVGVSAVEAKLKEKNNG